MRRSFIQQRPETFLLKYGHPLANELVFAGLGNSPGSLQYYDSSLPNIPSSQRYHLIFKQNNKYLKFGVTL